MPLPPRVPLQTLAVFRAAAHLQNLRAVAAELHLTHSAVSQQIRLLEERLGHPLFDRVGRRIRLNAAGEALRIGVDDALARIDAASQAAIAIASGEAERLRVTLLPSMAHTWLLPRMVQWRERHPAITVELHTSQEVIDVPRRGFHLAIRQGLGSWPGLESELLADAPTYLYAAPVVAVRLIDAPLAVLAAEPLLGSPTLWEGWFREGGLVVSASPIATFNDASLMLAAAELGLGITIASAVLAADAECEGRLVRLSDRPVPAALIRPHPRASSQYHLAWPAPLRDWAPLVTLRQWLHEEMARTLGRQASLPSLAGRGPGQGRRPGAGRSAVEGPDPGARRPGRGQVRRPPT